SGRRRTRWGCPSTSTPRRFRNPRPAWPCEFLRARHRASRRGPRYTGRCVAMGSSASLVLASGSHLLSRQLAGLLHPVRELGFVQLVVLVDVEVADLFVFLLHGRRRPQ